MDNLINKLFKFDYTLNDFFDITYKIRNEMNYLNLMSELHPNKQNEYLKLFFKYDKKLNEYTMNPKYFDFIIKNYDGSEVMKKLKREILMSGYGKNYMKLRKISDKLTEYESNFQKNINEDIKYYNNIKLTKGNYSKLIESIDNENERKKIYKLYTNIAYPQNDILLNKIIKLRKDYAEILGFNSFNELVFTYGEKLVKNEKELNTFFNKINKKYKNQYFDIINKIGGGDPWNIDYNLIKYFKENGLDINNIKKYFSLKDLEKGVFNFYEKMFNIKFVKKVGKFWDPKVENYDVFYNGKILGNFYLDKYPRKGKYNHFAVFPIKNYYKNELPICCLVMNYNDKYVSIYEIETFLHEMGHVIHFLFSRADNYLMSGTNCTIDFVEAPSQLMEKFLDEDFLKKISNNKLTNNEYKLIIQYNLYKNIINKYRQLNYSIFDIQLGKHVLPKNLNKLWNDILSKAYKIKMDSHGYCSFGHIAGGYESSYYSYLYSDLMADKIFYKFNSEKYRNIILINEEGNIMKSYNKYIKEVY